MDLCAAAQPAGGPREVEASVAEMISAEEAMNLDQLSTFEEFGRRGQCALRDQYRAGIAQSIELFDTRLGTLRERGIIRRTLVVFTSDHGELLGEYGGLTGHGRPSCPELVYVPTVVIHPSLDPAKIDSSGVARHVDLLPTIAEVLGIALPHEVDGVNLLDNPLPQEGLNFRKGSYYVRGGRLRNILKKLYSYEASSVWDSSGGHVFHGRWLRSIPFFIYKLVSKSNPESHFMNQVLRGESWASRLTKCCTALERFTSPYVRYGNPEVSRTRAEQILREYADDVDQDHVVADEPGMELGEEVEDRLRALGYID